MSILKSIRTLSDSAESLSSVALDSRADVHHASAAARNAAHDVSDAAQSVKNLADILAGLVLAVALGWAAGTLIRAAMDAFRSSESWSTATKAWRPFGMDKQTLER